MWAMNLGKAVEIPQLNEAMAIELGATLVSEAVIFATGAALVIAEVVRRNKKETAQEQARLDELEAMTGRIRDLEIETMRQDAQLRELSRLCLALQTKGEPSQVNPAAPPETKVDAGNRTAPTNQAQGGNNSRSVPIDPMPAPGEPSAGRTGKGLIQQAVESIVKI